MPEDSVFDLAVGNGGVHSFPMNSIHPAPPPQFPARQCLFLELIEAVAEAAKLTLHPVVAVFASNYDFQREETKVHHDNPVANILPQRSQRCASSGKDSAFIVKQLSVWRNPSRVRLSPGHTAQLERTKGSLESS